jgi:hypothetical protein
MLAHHEDQFRTPLDKIHPSGLPDTRALLALNVRLLRTVLTLYDRLAEAKGIIAEHAGALTQVVEAHGRSVAAEAALRDRLDRMGEVGAAFLTAQQRLLVDGSVRFVRDERGTIHVQPDLHPVLLSIIDRLRSGWKAEQVNGVWSWTTMVPHRGAEVLYHEAMPAAAGAPTAATMALQFVMIRNSP